MKLSWIVLLLVALSPQAHSHPLPRGVTAVTSVEGIDEYRLANGLQVLLIPDDSKPSTTVNMTVRVGSRHEGGGETGMAHLLEHMLFKGSPRHPKAWAEFEKRGLVANGSTSFDRTNYTATFSSNEENLRWYVGWLADALVNSHIARRDLDTEMTVVRNEMEMGENSPERALYKKALAVMYDWHPYGRDAIGARADIENVAIPSLRAFYRRYYQPDNTTLVVAGRFTPDRLLSDVAATLGRIAKPARKLPPMYTLDPVQEGERSAILQRVGGVPVMFAGYHIPAAAHPDFAPMEVLALVMGDTPSGRLHQRLTVRQLAASTFAMAQGLADPGFALFGAQLAPGQDVEAARRELIATLESASAQPIHDVEVQRARAKWLKDWEQTFTNPDTVGLALSESIAQGDWRLFFLVRDRVAATTTADVQRVALQRLQSSNRTLASYVPTDQPQRAPVPEKPDVAAELRMFKPQAAAAVVEPFDATPENIDARTQRFQIGGIKAAVLPKPTRGGAVHATLTLRFGDERSLANLGDVPDLTAALLDKGTTTLSREQIQDSLDALKTQMSVSSGVGSVSVSLVSRRDSLPQAIKLVSQVLRSPVFPAASLDEVKHQVLAGIAQQRKRPEALAENELSRLGNPYPKGDVRYVRTLDEIAQEIGAVDVEALRNFHRRFYGVRRAVFSAVGDFDPAAIRSALESGLGGWQAGDEPYVRVPRPVHPLPPKRLVIDVPDNQNATLLMRLPVPLSDSDPDYPTLTMANFLLGSGGTSRLWARVREGEGLSYDVRSEIDWANEEPNSQWRLSAIYAPQNREKLEAAVQAEIALALKDGFTARELEEGKRGLLNYRRLSRAQDGSLAWGLANNEHLGRTFATSARVDRAIAALTLSQVNAVLRKYVVPSRWASAVAGDFKAP